MKKILFVLALIMAFSGCFSGKIKEDAVYDRNLAEHWINGENGEKLNLGEHELGEYKPGDMVTCPICKSEISFLMNGGAEINNFDEKGNQIRQTGYSPEGSVSYDYVTEYRYGENDEIIYGAIYKNGKIHETYEYMDGTIQEEYFNEDGSRQLFITYYGYLGDSVINQSYYYDAEGNAYYESYTETFYDEEGNRSLSRKSETDHKTGIKTDTEYDENGEIISETRYDSSGKVIE